jgi:hypothetical protein
MLSRRRHCMGAIGDKSSFIERMAEITTARWDAAGSGPSAVTK